MLVHNAATGRLSEARKLVDELEALDEAMCECPHRVAAVARALHLRPSAHRCRHSRSRPHACAARGGC